MQRQHIQRHNADHKGEGRLKVLRSTNKLQCFQGLQVQSGIAVTFTSSKRHLQLACKVMSKEHPCREIIGVKQYGRQLSKNSA